MKYFEVFHNGMPMWLYKLKEKDILKFEFTADSPETIIISIPSLWFPILIISIIGAWILLIKFVGL